MSNAQLIVSMVAGLAMGASVSGVCLAQSRMHIGSNQDTRTCHQRAEQAVMFNASQRDDIEVCERALELDQVTRRDLAATLVNYGIVLMANGKPDEAEHAYEKALALNQDMGETYINIANVYLTRKQYVRAVQTYTQGLPLMARRQHVAYLNRGLAYEYLGQFSQAAQDYEQALKLRPDWVRAKKMQARALGKQDDANEP